jgi:hypothetical protein
MLIGTYDFVIFCQGRSGSHLLATALDSHPEVACDGENEGDSVIKPHASKKANVLRGRIVTYQQAKHLDLIKPTKIIYLVRDPFYCALSMVRNITKRWEDDLLPIHMLEKWYRQTKEQQDSFRYQLSERACLDNTSVLEMSYSELTAGGHAVRAIPSTVTRKICRFLGIRVYPRFKTATRKRSCFVGVE